MPLITIKEVKEAPLGTSVSFLGLLVNVNKKKKRNDEDYIEITVQDRTDTITFPVWDNFDHLDDDVRETDIVAVSGQVGRYNDMPQIQGPTVRVAPSDAGYASDDFVPAYDVPQAVVDDFKRILDEEVDDERYKALIMELIGEIGNQNDPKWKTFALMPSAVRNHGNKCGGLLLHTYGVIKAGLYAYKTYAEDRFFDYGDVEPHLNKSRLLFKCLVHDIGKLDEYSYSHGITRVSGKIDHRTLGIARLKKAMDAVGSFTNEEYLNIAYAILCHHGSYGNSEYKPATAEDKVLHAADLIDSQIVTHVEGKYVEER